MSATNGDDAVGSGVGDNAVDTTAATPSDHTIYILVRHDLGMTKGKMVAQGGHAVEGLVLATPADQLARYHRDGRAKICLRVDVYQRFQAIKAQLAAKNIPFYAVVDSGRTQVLPNTETCLALGPVLRADVVDVVGDLKLM